MPADNGKQLLQQASGDNHLVIMTKSSSVTFASNRPSKNLQVNYDTDLIAESSQQLQEITKYKRAASVLDLEQMKR
jgi:hypothetical protein